jgi:hypothetical protein
MEIVHAGQVPPANGTMCRCMNEVNDEDIHITNINDYEHSIINENSSMNS